MAGDKLKRDVDLKSLGKFLKRDKQSTAQFGGLRYFEYSAISPSGLRKKGMITAPSLDAVTEQLQEDGWYPLKVTETSNEGLNLDIGMLISGQKNKLTMHQLSTFFRQLSELLSAGVTISKALQSIADEADLVVRRVTIELIERVNAGVPISAAMAQFPDAFDEIITAYVSAGEASGTLPETMKRLSRTLEKRAVVANKIKAITAYPKFVSIAISLIIVAVLTNLVPMYARIYKGFGKPLPGPTLALLNITNNISPFTFTRTISPSQPIQTWLWFLAPDAKISITDILLRVITVLFFVGGWTYLRTRAGKTRSKATVGVMALVSIIVLFFSKDWKINFTPFVVVAAVMLIITGVKRYIESRSDELKYASLMDKILFRMPVFGQLNEKNALYRWSATLAGGVSSGVPLGRALEIAAKTTGSKWHKFVSSKIEEGLRSGKTLSNSLGEYKDLYPGNLRAMVATGEQTGELGSMLDSVAQVIDNEIDTIVSGLAAKIEVALLLVMGVVVGGMVLILYLPIINLAVSAGPK